MKSERSIDRTRVLDSLLDWNCAIDYHVRLNSLWKGENEKLVARMERIEFDTRLIWWWTEGTEQVVGGDLEWANESRNARIDWWVQTQKCVLFALLQIDQAKMSKQSREMRMRLECGKSRQAMCANENIKIPKEEKIKKSSKLLENFKVKMQEARERFVAQNEVSTRTTGWFRNGTDSRSDRSDWGSLEGKIRKEIGEKKWNGEIWSVS